MAERSKCDLPYGHYGRVQFSLDDNILEFGRALTTPLPIRILGGARITRRSSNSALPKNATVNAEPNGRKHAKQIQALVKQRPELDPASHLFGALLRTSEAVLRAAERHESARGNLISFVKVWSEIRHRSISVAAIVTGQTGSDLRLVQVQRQRQGWTEDRASWLEVPTLHGEEAKWSSEEGPILQVHSTTDAGGHDALLAVRLLSKTHILRPSHRKTPLENALSNLALDHLCTVGADDTGGEAHADVAFNPWFVQQLAFVGHDGAWTVLEFQFRDLQRITRSWHGSTGTKLSTDAFKLEDGWARIFWIFSLSTLLVCTRESLALVTLDAEGSATCTQIETDVLGNAVCIVDMILMPESRDAFVVLTRTHLVICNVLDNGSNNVRVTVDAKIRHFKSSEDLSLRLKAWKDQEDVFIALLSSLRSPICVFRLRRGAKDRVVCENPNDLMLFETRKDAQQLRDLHIQPLTLVTKSTQSGEQSTGPLHTRFYGFTALEANYTVFDGICCHSSAGTSLMQESIVSPLWEQKLPVPTQSRLRRETFVVDEELESEHEQQRSEPTARRARKQKSPLSACDKTVGLELVCDALHQRDVSSKDVQELASEVAAALASTHAETFEPMHSLYTMTQSDITTGDVQEASAHLQRSFGTVVQDMEIDNEPTNYDNKLQFKLEKVKLLPGLSTAEDGMVEVDAALASVYDQIISRWITSLAARVPGWVRLAKMNIAQRMAAETFLAAHTLRLEEVKAHDTQQSQGAENASEQTWELPVRASEPVSQTQPVHSSEARHISQHSALPTPSPTATPSVITASTGSFISAAPELHRLSKYTRFEKPAPMVLPRPLVKVLSHWEVGKDLDDYDWLASSRQLNQQEDNEAENDLTEKERKRMQRRAERHIMRQRKEAAASQASQMTSSQATEIMSASQPPAFKVESQPSGMPASSQSQGPSTGAVAASQVVPGRFGGRPPPKKRRKQGF